MKIEVEDIKINSQAGYFSGCDSYIWIFKINDYKHTLELRIIALGRKEVYLDNSLIIKDGNTFSMALRYSFEIENTKFSILKDDENYDVFLEDDHWICFKRIKWDNKKKSLIKDFKSSKLSPLYDNKELIDKIYEENLHKGQNDIIFKNIFSESLDNYNTNQKNTEKNHKDICDYKSNIKNSSSHNLEECETNQKINKSSSGLMLCNEDKDPFLFLKNEDFILKKPDSNIMQLEAFSLKKENNINQIEAISFDSFNHQLMFNKQENSEEDHTNLYDVLKNTGDKINSLVKKTTKIISKIGEVPDEEISANEYCASINQEKINNFLGGNDMKEKISNTNNVFFKADQFIEKNNIQINGNIKFKPSIKIKTKNSEEMSNQIKINQDSFSSLLVDLRDCDITTKKPFDY